MARIRTIKPEFFNNEDIVELSPLARLFYVSLWCESDREGRLVWKPKTLKLRYFPADDCDILALSKELIDLELIIIYEIEGKQYAEIPGFTKHQVINNRESESIIPVRIDQKEHATFTRVNASQGKEGREGREGASKSRKTSLPKNFEISDRVKQWASKKGVNNLDAHLENFILSCEKKNYKYVNWDSAFMGAIRDNWANISDVQQPDRWE